MWESLWDRVAWISGDGCFSNYGTSGYDTGSSVTGQLLNLTNDGGGCCEFSFLFSQKLYHLG